jgi:aminoglycoside phosphotransferase
VLHELLAAAPIEEDLVLTHGDFCLPNVIIRPHAAGAPRVAGLVDCGRAGVADRYQDIALGLRSIAYNFGGGAVPAFLEAYGLRRVDQAEVDFIWLLDEFF